MPAQKLPISPEELRAALKNTSTTQSTNNTFNNTPPPQKNTPSQQEIHREIAEFERAINTVPDSNLNTSKKTTQPQNTRTSKEPSHSLISNGFFDEYEQFLTHEGMGGEAILEQDVIARMRSFHQHKKEGQEYYLFSKDLETAAKRKLTELQDLENDWFKTQEQIDNLQKDTSLLEHEIETRAAELRSIIQQAKRKSRLEQQVKQGQEFSVVDGKKLSSLLDLKLGLHTMTEETFVHHVCNGRNDFAAWTWSCLKDEEAAKAIATTHNKQELLSLLGKLG